MSEVITQVKPQVEGAPVKRGRGRPKGSRNRPKVVSPVVETPKP